METQQIVALIAIILGVITLYWIAYLNGRNISRKEARHTAQIQQTALTGEITELKKSLGCARYLNSRLIAHCETIDARWSMGTNERQTLLAVANKLSLAARTFSSLPADKSQVDSLLTLRNQTLAMAERLAVVNTVEKAA